MTTTIQIREDTLNVLKQLKETYHAKTYDETLKEILMQKAPKSLAGFLGKGKKYSAKQILEGLRDERDRI